MSNHKYILISISVVNVMGLFRAYVVLIKSIIIVSNVNNSKLLYIPFNKSCPLFVPIVEEGWSNTDIASLTAKRYLKELMDENIDSLVLGCTHYPLLKRTIGEIVGENVKLVNPAKETVKDLKEILEKYNLLNNNEDASYKYYVSDIPDKFEALAKEFLNKEINEVKNVEIQKY